MSLSNIPRAKNAYDYPLLIRHLLHTPLSTTPHNEIVYAENRRYNYQDFENRLCKLASGLSNLGVRPGDTVAVMDWDSHRYLECFFAIPMMGAVLHTVNVRLSPEQILYTINHAEDDVIICHNDFIPIIEAIINKINRPCILVLINDSADHPETEITFAAEYEDLLNSGKDVDFIDFDENTRATTFYTTGTTGRPKGVYYSHRQIVLHTLASTAAIASSATQGRFHREDVYMPITPMFHVHAWGVPYMATMLGVKQVYPGRYEPEKLLQLIAKEQVTFSHCVPTILQMLLASEIIDEIDLSRWKVAIGGAALPPGMAREALARGIDIFAGYGLSETCPILTLSHLDSTMLDGDHSDQLKWRCKTGRPVAMLDLRVVDKDMQDIPRDGVSTGEVVVRSPWLTQGYLHDPEQSEELWQGGYLHTGDIASIDDKGYLKITDRIKDIIKSGGEWISSLELERIISEVPGVAEVAAIGLPDHKWGERPAVLIVSSSADLTVDIIQSQVKRVAEDGKISKWSVPDHVIFVDEIEKTSVGKIDKKILRRKYRSVANQGDDST